MGTLFLIIAIILISSISGCTLKTHESGEESNRDNPGTETTFLPEEKVGFSGKEINFDSVFGKDYFATLRYSFCSKNTIYIIADICEPDPNITNEDNAMDNTIAYIISVGKSGEDIKATPIYDFVPDDETALCFTCDESGNLIILTQAFGTEGIEYSVFKIDLQTMTEVMSYEVQITDIAQCISIAIDEQGNVYIYAMGNSLNLEILIYEPEHYSTKSIIRESVLSGAQLIRKEGRIYLAMRNDSGTNIKIYELGLESEELDNPITYNTENGFFGGMFENEFLYGISSEGLELFSNSDSHKIYTWREMGINSRNYTLPGLSSLSETSIAVVGVSGDDCKVHLSILEQTLQVQNTQRETLVIGGVSIYEDPNLLNTVDAFNAANKEFYAEVVDYADMGDLNLAILGGNAPDLIWGNQQSTYAALEEQGMLLDLTDMVSVDPVFSNEKVLLNIISLYEKNDGLYTLPLSVTLNGIAGTGLPSGAGWTPEEFADYAESLPVNTYALYGVSQMELLQDAVMPSMDTFVDWNNRECNFNTADFESLLVWAGTYGEKENEEDSVTVVMSGDELIQNGELAMEIRLITSPESYVSLEKLFGVDMDFKGFPSTGGNGLTLSSTATVSIYSGTENIDASWNFVQMAFSLDIQESVGGIPLNREALDKQILAAENFPSYMEDNPEYSTYTEMSFECEQRFRNLLESLSGTPTDNQPELWAILSEEAAAYFAGQKSAAETAEIIQNRVETMVREN